MRPILSRFATVARDLAELKRMRDQSTVDSVAERLFRRAWLRLGAGCDPLQVCLETVADALVATRLAGIDATMLAEMGVEPGERHALLSRSFTDAVVSLDAAAVDGLRNRLGLLHEPVAQRAAPFVSALIRQPRAGATAVGKPRLALEPAESHGDHCLVVAVLGTLIALHTSADPVRVFVAGLAHHLHNASLPDTGFAGEIMLGDALQPLMRRLFARELQTLTPKVRELVEDALLPIGAVDTLEGQAFNAADVIDRVLQAHHHARAASFTIDQALGDLQLVHEGPLQRFQLDVLSMLELV